MLMTQSDLTRRLAFILHRGFVEVRNLAGLPGYEQQIHDLADAMELLPRFLSKEATEDDLEMIRFVLQDYQEKYPTGRYDYLAYLEKCEPPERY
jgi:hypothetical protein